MSAPPNATIVLMETRGDQSSAGQNVSDIAKLSKWCLRFLETHFLGHEIPGVDFTLEPAQSSGRSGDFANLPFPGITPDRLAADSLVDITVAPCTTYMPRHLCTTFSFMRRIASHWFPIVP
jgi:hypothetical protein